MKNWKINTKKIEDVTVTNTVEKFSKQKTIEKKTKTESQLFESNVNKGVTSIEIIQKEFGNKSSTTNSLKIFFFNKSSTNCANAWHTELELKLKFSDVDSVDAFNKALEIEKFEDYKLNEEEKNKLEKTLSIWVNNATCMLSLINTLNTESPFTPKMQQELVQCFYQDMNNQFALEFKKALESKLIWHEPKEERSNSQIPQADMVKFLTM